MKGYQQLSGLLALALGCGASAASTTAPEPLSIASVPPSDPEAPLTAPRAPEVMRDPRVVQLLPGFAEPHTVDEAVTDSQPFEAWAGPQCIGSGAEEASHFLEVAPGFSRLVIFVASDHDTTLVVRAPDGTYHCNDDNVGTDPGLTISTPEAGRYAVWVGTYSAQQGSPAMYRLGISTQAGANAMQLLPLPF